VCTGLRHPSKSGLCRDAARSGIECRCDGQRSFQPDRPDIFGSFISGPAALQPSVRYVNNGVSEFLDGYTGFTGPTSFGSGGFTSASSSTGDSAEIWADSAQFGRPLLWVPAGYVSGSALSETSIYNNATFANLAVIPGTYTWTWGSGPNQSFTLEIPNPVPGPIVGAGVPGLLLVSLGWLGWRRRERRQTATSRH
jgi:hypothetical protein